MRDGLGCGLYTAGIVVSPAGGAFVVVEKRPRKTGRLVDVQRNGYVDQEDEWEDLLAVVGAERLTGRATDMVERIAERLNAAPMKDDAIAYFDIGEMGETLRRMFHARECWPLPMQVGGEAEATDAKTGIATVPIAALQTNVTVAFERGRLVVVDQLADGPTLLRAVENLAALPSSGPTRDLAYATAIAVWTANRFATHGSWASRKAPRPGTPGFEQWRRERELRNLVDEMRAEQTRPWWDPRSRGSGWGSP